MHIIVIQVVIFQVLFLIAYELLFRKETFFNWNRAYLLITSLASIVLSFIKLDFFSKVVPTDFFINLATVIIGEESKTVPLAIHSLPSTVITTNSFSIDYSTIWGIGALFFTIVLCNKLYRLWKYKHNNSIESRKEYSLITIKNSIEAFSFLQTIFLGDGIEDVHKESIINHEKVHVKEKHTLDLLWFEALRIVMWFNPLIYLYQQRITEVHEFIADKSASKHQQNYYENLLAKTFNIAQFSVVNQFYSSSLIKKRIIMLTKEQSQKRKLVKYLSIIPIVLAMLVYVSCNDTLETEINNEASSLKEEEVIKDVFSIVNNTLPSDIENEMPFSKIDQAPIFPGSKESNTETSSKKIFSQSLSKHINDNFNTNIAKEQNLKGKQKIFIGFKIDKNGKVKDIKARAPHIAVKEEAIRVMETLPKMKPAIHNNENVAMVFSIPVIFSIE